MKYRLIIFILLLLAPSIVTAHEYWLVPTAPVAAVGASLEVDLCAGHQFPRCEAFDFPDTFTAVVVLNPQGKARPVELLETDADGKAQARWAGDAPGRHAFVLQLILNHPRRGEIPLYTARTEVRVLGEVVPHAAPTTGRGLEIFLVEDLGAIENLERLTLQASLDGQPVQTSLQVSPAKGRKYALNTDRDGRVEMRRTHRGPYLIHTSAQGMSGSLYFVLP